MAPSPRPSVAALVALHAHAGNAAVSGLMLQAKADDGRSRLDETVAFHAAHEKAEKAGRR